MRDYEMFMRDYLKEDNEEEYNMLEPMEEATDKSDVYKINYYFRDNLQLPKITPVMAKQKNRNFVIDFVGKFLDAHVNQLSTPGPVYTFTFGEKEMKPIYEMFDLTPDQLLEMYKKMVDETYYGKISKMFTGWVTKAPHKLILCAMAADAYQNGYDDIVECCEYMFAFTEYPIMYREFWKLGVQEDVMKYTIEHLGNKFKIKEFENILGLLKYDTTTAVTFYKEPLSKDGPDYVYMEIIRRVRNQIQSKFRNIANAYFDNIENNASQHTNVSVFDDGKMADQEGHTVNMSLLIDKINSRIMKADVITSIAATAAKARKVDKSNTIAMLSQIMSTKNNRVDKFVEDVITSYFEKYPYTTSLDSNQFLNYGLSMYRSIGTSKNKFHVEIRSILSYWMNDIVNIRGSYERDATVINYTRAVFDYMIMLINYYS